jgi:GT2 family glycosyltransferase
MVFLNLLILNFIIFCKGNGLNYRKVALVVTSCGRFDLLEKTLKSFSKFNGFPISEVIVVEDSCKLLEADWVSDILGISIDLVRVIQNPKNLGQIRSIDLAYEQVTADFIFHCEDDWEFLKPGFIEYSLDVLDSDSSVFCVWLRGLEDTNRHPIEKEIKFTNSGLDYRYMVSNYLGKWSGFTFNPGLRRSSDCLRFWPYSGQALLDTSLSESRGITESDISMLYHLSGYVAAIHNNSYPYVRHLGEGQHIRQSFESFFRIVLRNLVHKIKYK